MHSISLSSLLVFARILRKRHFAFSPSRAALKRHTKYLSSTLYSLRQQSGLHPTTNICHNLVPVNQTNEAPTPFFHAVTRFFFCSVCLSRPNISRLSFLEVLNSFHGPPPTSSSLPFRTSKLLKPSFSLLPRLFL